MVVRIRREKYIFIRFGRFTLPNLDGWDQTAMEQRFKCLRLPIYRSVILLEFSLTWSCVSLTRPTTSNEWKLFRFDKMEVNSFSNIAEWCHVLSYDYITSCSTCLRSRLEWRFKNVILTFESQIFLNFHTIVIYCHQKTHSFCKPKFTLCQNVIFITAFIISLHWGECLCNIKKMVIIFI